ncbi:MAG: SIMPL domain-containing protein [Gaiellaceae bacterium]
MRTRHVVWLAGALAFASLFAGIGLPLLSHAAGKDAKAGTVTVNGTGTVNTVPDTASMSFGVTTQAATAAAALAQNSSDAAKVIAALKDAGIAAKDIQTQSVSLQPRPNGTGDAIVGYTASNSVGATVRDIGHLGPVIDAAVAAGANTVNGPSLTREGADALYRDALKAAVADARAKAGALADAAKLSLGAVQSMSEGGGGVPLPFAAGRAADVTSTPIEPGTQQVQATVTVTFALG